MAKDKKGGGTTSNNDKSADSIIASNREVIKQLNEISNQSAAVFNVAKDAIANFREEIDSLSDVLSEQCEKVKCFKEMAESLDTAKDSTKSLTSAISGQASQAKKLADSLGFKKSGSGYAKNQNIFEEVASSSKQAKFGILVLAQAMKTLQGAASLVSGVFSTVTGIISTFISMVGTAIKTIVNFGVSLYEGLFSMANDYLQILNELDRKREEIRDKFGDTAYGIGKSVYDMGRQLYAGGAAGLSGFQLFKDEIEAMSAAISMAEAGGAAFEHLREQFGGKGINELYAYMKGLGLTTKEFGDFTKLAVTSDLAMTDMYKNINKVAKGMVDKFGGSFKMVARDITKARIDVKHFANVSDTELGIAATYANKLGVELENIVGIVDAFDTFDSAAEKAARLSQAFHMNIDLSKIMTAKTPAHMLDQLRESFFATGKSVEDLHFREVKYLAQQANISEATAMQVFSMKNRGVAIEQLTKKGISLEQQTLTTMQSMQGLMGQIPRFIREIKNEAKGFFETFFDGFGEGVVMSSSFRGTMMSIAEAIKQVKQAGRELGQAFVNYFPGVREMLESISRIMPHVGSLFHRYAITIENFFKKLHSGKGVVSSLFDELIKETKTFFNEIGPEGQLFMSGASKFFQAIKKIAQETLVILINVAGDLMTSFFKAIADWLEGKKGKDNPGNAFMNSIQKGINDAISGTRDFFAPIRKAFGVAMDKVGPELKRIWVYLGNSMKEWFNENKFEIAKTIGGIITLAVVTSLPQIMASRAMSALINRSMGAPGGGGGMPGMMPGMYPTTVATSGSRNVMSPASSRQFQTAGGQAANNFIKGANTRFQLTPGKALAGAAASFTLGYASEIANEAGNTKTAATLSTAGNIMGDAVTGAMLGSMGGPVAAALGGMLGGAVGLTRSLLGQQGDELFGENQRRRNAIALEEKLKSEDEFVSSLEELAEQAISSGDKIPEVIAQVTAAKEKATRGANIAKLGQALDKLHQKQTGATATQIREYEAKKAAKSLFEEIAKLDEELAFGGATLPRSKLEEIERNRRQKISALAEFLPSNEDMLSQVVGGQAFRGKKEYQGTAAQKMVEGYLQNLVGLPSGAMRVERHGNMISYTDESGKRREFKIGDSGQLGKFDFGKLASEILVGEDPRKEGERRIAEEKLRVRGREMIEMIGETNLDNAEERFQMVKRIGEKVLGKGKVQIEEKLAQIRTALGSINFTLFTDETQGAQFEKAVGSMKVLNDMIAAFKTTIAGLQSMPAALAGLGSIDQPTSILGKVYTSANAFAKGMKDIIATVAGGTLSNGKQAGGLLKDVTPEEISSFVTVSGNIDSLKEKLAGVGGSANSAKEVGGNFANWTRAVFTGVEGMSNAALRASASLAKLGNIDQENSPANKLMRGTGGLKKVLENINDGASKMKEITEKWKSGFMLVSIDDFAAQVVKLAENANSISLGISSFESAAKSIDTRKISSGYDALKAAMDAIKAGDASLFTESFQNPEDFLPNTELATKVVAKLNTDIGSKLTGASTANAGSVRIDLNVQIDAAQVASAIAKDKSNVIIQGILAPPGTIQYVDGALVPKSNKAAK